LSVGSGTLLSVDSTTLKLSVRMRGIAGIADYDWLKLTPGISVLTGRNNVGKSRVLLTIATLAQIAGGGGGFTPESRLEGDNTTIEMSFDPPGFLARFEAIEGDKGSHTTLRASTGRWHLLVDGVLMNDF